MKKTLLLAVAALFVFSAVASAVTVSTTLYPGLNLIAPSVVPFDPIPTSVYKDNTGADIYIDQNLIRWDGVNKGYITYDMFGDPAVYGNVLLGDGAWLRQDAQVIWQYNGVPDGVPSDPSDASTQTDMWVSLPTAGLTMIGHPFNHNVPLANCKITDGTQTLSMEDARSAGWCDATVIGWDAVGQGYYTVFIDPWESSLDLEAFHGYWINTTRDNLALIIPAN